MASSRKSTDSNASQPAFKVVGFHVEGVPPSPDNATLLQDALISGGGSPDPVMIPPSFQNEGSVGKSLLSSSPVRQHTLPSFHPEDGGNMRDLLGNVRSGTNYSSTDLGRPGGQAAGLSAASSLPPMTSMAAAELKNFASSFADLSPRKRQFRESQSQPASAAPTPPVSPYKDEFERPLSSSHRPSAFEAVQSQDQTQLPATFSDGHRMPERHRPILAHMGATYSDGSKMPAQHGRPNKADLVGARTQHGFEIASRHRQETSGAQPATSRAGVFNSTALGSPIPEVPERLGSSPQAQPSSGPAASSTTASDEPASTSTTASGGLPSAAPAQPEASKAQSIPTRAPAQSMSDKAAGKQPAGQPGSQAAAAAEEKKKPTKAERRATQDRQRAEKAAAKEAEGKGKGPAGGRPSNAATPRQERTLRATPQAAPPPAAGPKAAAKPAKAAKQPASKGQTSEMFAHLPQYKAVTLETIFQNSPVASKVHPSVLQLGLKYANGTISGGNARCLAMLLVLKTVIQDYKTPESKELSRDLTAQLNTCIHFLVDCRPLSVSMGNAIKYLKLRVSQIDAQTPESEAKALLLEDIDNFIQEKITFADEQIARTAETKVASGDVILTFAYSSAVFRTLLQAKQAAKEFRVIVADSRPHYEGREMLAKLLAHGIPCTYLQLNALCYSMQEASKVFMGASGAMSNGTILARAGSASVAMVADAMQRPVIICCETLKFVDRVQLDSITYNELGSPDALATVNSRPDLTSLQAWQDQPQLELLNLVYDAMPCDYVSLIVTEVGAIPPTSVPVVLREYRTAPKM